MGATFDKCLLTQKKEIKWWCDEHIHGIYKSVKRKIVSGSDQAGHMLGRYNICIRAHSGVCVLSTLIENRGLIQWGQRHTHSAHVC